ncbi:MAG: hypothetical protein AAF747_00530 [Planctomycetota bacterium]
MHHTNTPADGATERRRWLIAANIGLGVALLAVLWSPPMSQAQPGNRAPGEYALVGGETRGGDADAIWVIDATNQEMLVLRYNDSRHELQGIGYRDLDADLKRSVGR